MDLKNGLFGIDWHALLITVGLLAVMWYAMHGTNLLTGLGGGVLLLLCLVSHLFMGHGGHGAKGESHGAKSSSLCSEHSPTRQ